MNKKIVSLILVILISFCLLSIVVADSAIHDANSTNHDKTADKDKKIDNNKKTNNKTNDKPKGNYILAMGSGNDILFSDGFRGFIIGHSKRPAKSGDEFKRASAQADDLNAMKLKIIKSYMQDSGGRIGSNIRDHEVVRIDNDTEAIFDFEVLKSVSGNVSDYLAYQVSFRSIDVEKDINQTNNMTNTTNITNATNITNLTQLFDNQTNATFLKGLYDYLLSLASALYDAWKPIADTLLNGILMMINALEGLADLYAGLMMEINSLMDAFGKLLEMLESLWNELDGIFKLLAILMNLIQQLLDLIQAIIDFIMQLINAIIAFIMALLEWLYNLIMFLLDLLYQLLALIQAILEFLAAIGSFLLNVIESAVIIISAFVIITIGAFVYNRIR